MAATPLAYIDVNSQSDALSSPAKHHWLTLIDGDTETMWCPDPGASEPPTLVFRFKKPQTIDRLTLTPPKPSAMRIKTMRLSSRRRAVRIAVEPERTERKLDPPMQSMRYTLVIGASQKQSQGDTPDQPQDVPCIAEIRLWDGEQPWGGQPIPERYSQYHRFRTPLLDEWASGTWSAPERFLVMAVDGTWQWRFEPLLDGKPDATSGEYRFRGDRLLMRVGQTGRWIDMNWKLRGVNVDPSDPDAPEGDYHVLELNQALGERLAGTYRNAEF